MSCRESKRSHLRSHKKTKPNNENENTKKTYIFLCRAKKEGNVDFKLKYSNPNLRLAPRYVNIKAEILPKVWNNMKKPIDKIPHF